MCGQGRAIRHFDRGVLGGDNVMRPVEPGQQRGDVRGVDRGPPRDAQARRPKHDQASAIDPNLLKTLDNLAAGDGRRRTRPGMREVAQAAGVAMSSVSRVLPITPM